ncbi:MAG: hypothetical protein LC104_07430 [Bacteroidales bacterium]|nr:hypothetical protein [Bacteroidales bacterium]
MKIGIAFDLKPDTPFPPTTSLTANADDWAEEFDSPATIAALAEALRTMGHSVVELHNGPTLLTALLADPPDLVFNIAEGHGHSRNREARVPAVCEMLGIPYTGSDPLTLAVALDKTKARTLAAAAGVTLPAGCVLPPLPPDYDGDFAEFGPLIAEAGLRYPVIAKPAWEGSSKGICHRCLIERPDDLGAIVQELGTGYRQPILLEEFIAGEEVTLGIVGNDPPQVLGAMRIIPRDTSRPFVYSLEVKRNYAALVDYECPAQLPPAVMRELEASAFAVWDALDCRDVARFDYRIRDGVPYFLEVNPLPGLNPVSSDLVLIARAMGMRYHDLIQTIVQAAESRM